MLVLSALRIIFKNTPGIASFTVDKLLRSSAVSPALNRRIFSTL